MNFRDMTWPKWWTDLPAPGIAPPAPPNVARLMKYALRSVDRDVEQYGSVSEDTINLVRAALALARNC